MLTDKLLVPEAQDILREVLQQIVAMTDLPIECMMIEGIALIFTHAMCRFPENPDSLHHQRT